MNQQRTSEIIALVVTVFIVLMFLALMLGITVDIIRHLV